ncbi:hypothetical protein Pan44_14070 [Caulifigura coniformis]|uniref:Nickel uptake substrate-specific transmembrane region n=1 Tax=Caulifigura coniformis TaxID=2527983 RepID=A0A517SB67_9PLAN|nr:carboxypeptidase-like regulatory domain-containing protein [Caulifigura coniformis]QDT53390.1 hypothetical protein Pan44_14070 [Caulifigura coniformis]
MRERESGRWKRVMCLVAAFCGGFILPAVSVEVSAADVPAAEGTWSIEGECTDGEGVRLGGVEVEVFLRIRFAEPGEPVCNTTSDATGRFRIPDLPVRSIHARPEHSYYVVARSPGRTSAVRVVESGSARPKLLEMKLRDRPGQVSGRVTDSAGKPIAGAIIAAIPIGAHPCAAIMAAESDADGRYSIEDLEPIGPSAPARPGGPVLARFLRVYHPDYPITVATVTETPQVLDVTLRPGGRLEGRVMDAATGRPAEGVTVIAKGLTTRADAFATTNRDGEYRFQLLPDAYAIRCDAEERTCVPLVGIDVQEGATQAAADLSLIEGALIEGVVENAATGLPATVDSTGRVLSITLRGPAFPQTIGAVGSAAVQADGTFRIRAAPGLNQVYPGLGIRAVSITPSGTLDVKEGERVGVRITVNLPEAK